MKIQYDIKEISKDKALEMIKKYHYSNTLAKLNKHFLGFFVWGELVGVVTLGWGTRPRHTIQKIFPTLDTKDYLEIGRMAMTDEMPRNSESQMLSQMIKWVKENLPEVKVILTWADGMQGKVGYVYQASNFIYTGRIDGEMYIRDNVKIHVRQMKSVLLADGEKDKRLTIRPTLEQMRLYNIRHYKGNQYRYIYFVCDRKTKRHLIKDCICELYSKRPKEKDLWWKVRNVYTGKWEYCERPCYTTDFNQETREDVIGKVATQEIENGQITINEYIEMMKGGNNGTNERKGSSQRDI